MNHEIHEEHEIKNQEKLELYEIQDKVHELREKSEIPEKVLYKEECYRIQGALFEVYREMGCGFLEGVYQECLEKEFIFRRIPFKSQVQLGLFYKGEQLNQTFKPDFVCFDRIIVELKAVKELDDIHRAQVFNYLKATGMHLGLLVNFGHFPKITIERYIF
jgi:GxxExxY protein